MTRLKAEVLVVVPFHDVDVMGLAPGSNLLRFRQAADVTDVDPSEIEQSLLDKWRELPFI